MPARARSTGARKRYFPYFPCFDSSAALPLFWRLRPLSGFSTWTALQSSEFRVQSSEFRVQSSESAASGAVSRSPSPGLQLLFSAVEPWHCDLASHTGPLGSQRCCETRRGEGRRGDAAESDARSPKGCEAATAGAPQPAENCSKAAWPFSHKHRSWQFPLCLLNPQKRIGVALPLHSCDCLRLKNYALILLGFQLGCGILPAERPSMAAI